MKASSVREQTDEELLQTLRETQKRLEERYLKRGVGEDTEQPLLVRTLRRDVARLKTVIRERGLKDHD